jgi:hypothetical protein
LVLSNDSIKNKNIDELKDHLYCEVENFIKQGQAPQQAFKTAIAKMGEVDMLAGEYQKNRTFLNKLCAFEYGTVAEHSGKPMNQRKMVMQQSILWAAAMIATALVVSDSKEAMSVVFMVLLPLSIVNLISLKRGTKKK